MNNLIITLLELNPINIGSCIVTNYYLGILSYVVIKDGEVKLLTLLQLALPGALCPSFIFLHISQDSEIIFCH